MAFLLFKTLILTFFLSLTFAANLNENNSAEIFAEDVTPKPYPAVALAKCQESICTRIYRPICVSINGSKITIPSRCHLARHRCLALRRNLKNLMSPPTVLRVLYNGECYDKSKLKRKTETKRRQNSKFMQFSD